MQIESINQHFNLKLKYVIKQSIFYSTESIK